MDNIKMEASALVKDEGSQFTAYAAEVSNLTEIRMTYRRVRLLHPEADNVVMAYTTSHQNGEQDDREFSAALRLQKLLHQRKAKNTAIFVARVFGGTPLGPKRFTHIEAVATEALDALVS